MRFLKIFLLTGAASAILLHGNFTHAQSFYSSNHGPYFSLSYAPKGYGSLLFPSKNGISGTEISKPDSKNIVSSASRFSCSSGYYYGIIQGDLSFDKTSYTTQFSDNSATNGGNAFSGGKSVFLARIGGRFSHPGDTSWQFLYLGFKRTNISIDPSQVNLTAYGFTAGCSAFFSRGISSDMEFVITGNLFLGNYQWIDFSSTHHYTNIKKKYSVSAGGSLGVGLQYEPYNATILFKLSSDADVFSLQGRLNGQEESFFCGAHGHTLGFEMIYAIPSIQYNRLPGENIK